MLHTFHIYNILTYINHNIICILGIFKKILGIYGLHEGRTNMNVSKVHYTYSNYHF